MYLLDPIERNKTKNVTTTTVTDPSGVDNEIETEKVVRRIANHKTTTIRDPSGVLLRIKLVDYQNKAVNKRKAKNGDLIGGDIDESE